MTKTSLADMKTGFPQAPEPIQGIPTLQSLIKYLFHCCCAQTQRSPASATMNLLFCAAPPNVYAFLTAEAYPATCAPFTPIVLDVPNYTACSNNNKCATVKATHAIDKKTWADIITMNTALADIFLKALSLQVRTSLLQRYLCILNIVWLTCSCDLLTTTERPQWRIAKQTISKWQPTGILPMVLTHSSFASSPAQHLQDAPTSRWPTVTLSTSASA
jgi:hypothetical protein